MQQKAKKEIFKNDHTTPILLNTFKRYTYFVINNIEKVMTKVNESYLKSNIYHLKQTIQKQKVISTVLKCGIIYQTAHTQ